MFSRLKGTPGNAAQDALRQADNAVQEVPNAAQNSGNMPIDPHAQKGDIMVL